MRLYNVHTLFETQHIIKENFQNFETEIISIDVSLNCILSDDIYANINVPTFRRSTVDGYAVVSNDTNGATDTMPMILDYIGESEMGDQTDLILKSGQLMYVPTGGMVPEGADSMVMIEYTEKFSNEEIAVLKQSLPQQHIVKIGDDVQKGSLILKKGTKLSSRHIGALAATGIFKIPVYKKIRVSIISTGDELITTDQELIKGQVFDINTHTLKQHATQLDLVVVQTYVLKDNRDLIKETIKSALEKSDVVLISGGSSVGFKDYTADIIEELSGKEGLLIHGLAIKPGKPTILGKIDHKLVLGLPGHPVSALIVFDQLIRMYLNQIMDANPIILKKKLSKNIHAAPGKETFVMVKIEGDSVLPILGKSSMITTMSLADGYIRISEDQEGLNQGDDVDIYLLD